MERCIKDAMHSIDFVRCSRMPSGRFVVVSSYP